MDQTQTDTPPAPPQPLIVVSQDVLVMSPEQAAVFATYDRRLPMALRVECARLSVASSGRRHVDPLIVAQEQHDDERSQ